MLFLKALCYLELFVCAYIYFTPFAIKNSYVIATYQTK